MSRELIGNYGNIVGSVHYFEQLNRENFVGNLMRQSQSTTKASATMAICRMKMQPG